MSDLSYKTISANKTTTDRKWVLIDAENEVLGRLASKVANLLRGKHKTNYTPHVVCGDKVVIVNAGKIKLTGNKWTDKIYMRYTGYPGGQRTMTAEKVMEKNPVAMVEKSVKGMLPKNKLGSELFRQLYVYSGPEHQQEARKPEKLELKSIR